MIVTIWRSVLFLLHNWPQKIRSKSTPGQIYPFILKMRLFSLLRAEGVLHYSKVTARFTASLAEHLEWWSLIFSKSQVYVVRAVHSQVPITVQIKSVFRVGALKCSLNALPPCVLTVALFSAMQLSWVRGFQSLLCPICVSVNTASWASVSRHGTDNALKYKGWFSAPAVHTHSTEGQTWNFYAYQTSTLPFISNISQLSLHWFALVCFWERIHLIAQAGFQLVTLLPLLPI